MATKKNEGWITVSPPDNRDSKVWDYREEGEGAQLEGRYIGSKENLGKDDSTLYLVETEDGLRSVWHTTVLGRQLKEVPRGAQVRITYQGMEKGDKHDYHNFQIDYKPLEEGEDGDEDIPF